MALRSGHGTGSGVPRVEVLPPDELPPGVAGPPTEPSGAVKRGAGGRIADSEAARAMAKRSAAARARRKAVMGWGQARGLGDLLPEGLKVEPLIRPFVDESNAWLDAQRTALAADVGGGRLNPDASSMLETAALQRLFAKFWSELAMRAQFVWDVVERDEEDKPKRVVVATELALAAAQMGNASRQNLLGAWELAAKAAKARESVSAGDDLAQRRAAFQRQLAEGTDT